MIERQNHRGGIHTLFRFTLDLYCGNALSKNMVGFSPINCHHRYRSRLNKNLFMAIQESLVEPPANKDWCNLKHINVQSATLYNSVFYCILTALLPLFRGLSSVKKL